MEISDGCQHIGRDQFGTLMQELIKRMLAGDTDGDWDVDVDDLDVLLATFGGAADWRTDFNEDGRVDLADFVIMRANFEEGVGSSTNANNVTIITPEPTTMGMLALGGLAVLKRRRRRK